MKSEAGSTRPPEDQRAESQLPDAMRCPVTGGRLEFEPDRQWVRVVGHPLRYPVRGGIPVLVSGAAQPIESDSDSSESSD